MTNNINLDRKFETDILNKKLTSEIENLKDMINSRDEEIKVLLGIIDRYKAMEENFKNIFKKDLDPNKRLIDRLDEEDKKLADIKKDVYGEAMEFEKIKFNKNENLINLNENKHNNNPLSKNEDSKNTSFSNGNTKSTNTNSNMTSMNPNNFFNSVNTNTNSNNGNSQMNNFMNKNNINSSVNTSIGNNTNNPNYNPIPISLLKEINTANTYLIKSIEVSKDIISNDLKLYDLFKNNYVKFSVKDEENKKIYLKEKFESGQIIAKEYLKLKEMSNSIKPSVIIYFNY